HHLETYFDQLRSEKRTLDRPSLDLCFRCLDALRDYHRDLRSQGRSGVDLTALAGSVLAMVEGEAPAIAPAEAHTPAPPESGPEPEPEPEPESASMPSAMVPPNAIALTVRFEPNLPWPDMKAKLVLSRLAAKARVLATDPPAEHLERVEAS